MTHAQDEPSPIFIHSLFRSGSTYLFNVFRRSSAGYWCYQEPIHEMALFAKDDPDCLISFTQAHTELLRHPSLDRPYFFELHETIDYWRESLTKEIIYDDYFGKHAEDDRAAYLRALIAGARGRPVIQECRTASRVQAIRQDIGGVHLCLWRNPWDQWWSYKVTDYFDTANQLILNAPDYSEVVTSLKQEIHFTDFHHKNIREEFAHFNERRLSAENSYLVFYTLWCLGLLEGMSHADMLINIDTLSDSQNYRKTVLHHLTELGVGGISFADCSVAQAHYGVPDRIFFKELEEKAHGFLARSGYPQSQIDAMLTLRHAHEPSRWSRPLNDLSADQAMHATVKIRALARRFESREALMIHHMLTKVQAVQQELTDTQQALADTQQSMIRIKTELAAVYRSKSWRITWPLRKLIRFIRQLINFRHGRTSGP